MYGTWIWMFTFKASLIPKNKDVIKSFFLDEGLFLSFMVLIKCIYKMLVCVIEYIINGKEFVYRFVTTLMFPFFRY